MTEQAVSERDARHPDPRALIVPFYVQRRLADRGPLPGIDADGDEAIERLDELVGDAPVTD